MLKFSSKDAALFTALISVTFMLFISSLTADRFHAPAKETVRILASRLVTVERSWMPQMENAILNIRLPRLFGAILVGGSLALSGATQVGVNTPAC
jgi:iron complex transport system permease protein